MPVINELQQERGRGAFHVVALNAGQTREEARAFIEFLGAPFLYALDRDLTISDAYGVYGLPLSVLVDANGVVRGVYHGHADRARLESLLDAADARRMAEVAPPTIRLISTVPRDNVLTVARVDGGVKLTSRRLRCDASYCAESFVELSGVPGVWSVSFSAGAAEPSVTLKLSPGADERAVVL
jgi:hypothetical protein